MLTIAASHAGSTHQHSVSGGSSATLTQLQPSSPMKDCLATKPSADSHGMLATLVWVWLLLLSEIPSEIWLFFMLTLSSIDNGGCKAHSMVLINCGDSNLTNE